VGRGVADRRAHHFGGGRVGRTGRSGGHHPARRRDTVQRRTARGRAGDRGTGDRVRREVGDPLRLEACPPVGIARDAANGLAGQSDDGRRHRVAAAARPRTGDVDLGSHRRASVLGGHHVDIRTADRHRHRPGRSGECAAQLVCYLGRRHSGDGGSRHHRAVRADASGQRRRPQGRRGSGCPAHRVAQARARRAGTASKARRHLQSGRSGVGSGRGGQGRAGACGVCEAPTRRTRRPGRRRACRAGTAQGGRGCGGQSAQRRRRAVDHRHRRAAAVTGRTGGDADPR
jgi:hypothetical protein